MLKFHTAETDDGEWKACTCDIGEDHTSVIELEDDDDM